MAITSKVLVPAKQAEAAQTTQYTASAATAIIDKFTVTNTSGSNVSFSANLVQINGAPGTSNLLINARNLAPRESYSCPELVGHVLESGGFISTMASAAGSLTIRGSGREIT